MENLEKKIRVLIVDDSKFMRNLLEKILSADPDILIVGKASDPYIARDLIKKVYPHVLTLDVMMPGMDGITFLKNLMRLHPLPVVMISSLTEQGSSIALEALALGADYVMLGNILNKSIESSGDNYLFGKIKINHKLATIFYDLGLPIYKKFRGMSTKEVQKKWGKETLTTSEGVVRFRKVEYRLDKWIENFEDYLRSAMSYSDAYTLDEFIGKANIIRISDNAYNRFKK